MGSAKKLAVLGALYLVQGLPFGFQGSALQLYLLDRGVSLAGVGFAGALALPWMLKILFAPFVDRYYSRRFGRRRSWILPLQAGLASTCLAAAFVPADEQLAVLLGLVFAMNLFAAIMDIAVDGLAVDVLEPGELGYGNIAQVVGYKFGMLAGGGLSVWASDYVGWSGAFGGMAVVVVVVMAAIFVFSEPKSDRRSAEPAPTTLPDLLALLARALRVRSMMWLLLFVATYKVGESMADAMFKPFLYGVGFSKQDIALWVVSWGMGFSILGSVLGGVLASRISLLRAVAITATLRALAVGGEWWLSTHVPTSAEVITVTAVEHLCGGALTTAMFALMMSSVDSRIGATHYTLLATVEVAGKAPGALLSGVVAQRWSLMDMFGLATLLSVAFLGLLWPVARATGRPSAEEPSPGS